MRQLTEDSSMCCKCKRQIYLISEQQVTTMQDIVKVRLVDTHDHVLSTYDRQSSLHVMALS